MATVAKGQQVYQWAKRYQVPIAFGTDLWGPQAQQSQLREFEMRIELDDPLNIIRSATRINAELLRQSGNLGTISAGAYADLLVVEGDPLRDVKVMTDPQKNLKLIMKDSVIYKNEL
jgi:imidazolonepropionase-like amidohydrolase